MGLLAGKRTGGRVAERAGMLTPIMCVAYPAARRCCATVTSSMGSTLGTESENAVWMPVWMTYRPVLLDAGQQEPV